MEPTLEGSHDPKSHDYSSLITENRSVRFDVPRGKHGAQDDGSRVLAVERSENAFLRRRRSPGSERRKEHARFLGAKRSQGRVLYLIDWRIGLHDVEFVQIRLMHGNVVEPDGYPESENFPFRLEGGSGREDVIDCFDCDSGLVQEQVLDAVGSQSDKALLHAALQVDRIYVDVPQQSRERFWRSRR